MDSTSVTESEQGQRLLYELFTQAPAPIVVFRGPELIVEMANPRALSVLGGRPLVGEPLLQALPELAGDGFDKLLERVMQTGEPYVADSMLATLARSEEDAPEETYWNFAYSPVRGPDGRVERVLLIAFEVTEQVLARKSREHYIKELQGTLQLNELIMGVLGHDLRTPIAAILMTARALVRTVPDDTLRTALRRIVESAERMNRMINQLLDFTRVRLGHGMHLVRQSLDLGDLCKAIIAELEAAYARKFAYIERGSTLGRYDRDRLYQVLTNLGSNACQHGAPGVPITFLLDGTDEQRISLEVQSGGTIPEELLPVLFEPFQSRAVNRDKPHEGVGLGLYISRQVVLAHGGEMRVSSDSAQGTRFIVSLPRE